MNLTIEKDLEMSESDSQPDNEDMVESDSESVSSSITLFEPEIEEKVVDFFFPLLQVFGHQDQNAKLREHARYLIWCAATSNYKQANRTIELACFDINYQTNYEVFMEALYNENIISINDRLFISRCFVCKFLVFLTDKKRVSMEHFLSPKVYRQITTIKSKKDWINDLNDLNKVQQFIALSHQADFIDMDELRPILDSMEETTRRLLY